MTPDPPSSASDGPSPASLDACGRLDRLLEESPVVIYSCRPDPELRPTYISGNLERLLGYRREELLGKAVWPEPLVHPDDRPDALRQVETLLAEGGGLKLRYRLRHKQGHYVWVQSEKRLICNVLGEPVELIGALLDISEQQHLSQRLEKLSEQLPGFAYQYQRTPQGHGCFPYASRGSREIYGVEPETLKASDAAVFEAIHPQDAVRVAGSIEASARALTPWHCEYRVCHPEGHQLWVSGVATPERLEDGTVVWHGFMADITQQKRTRLELEASEARYRRITENISDVVALHAADDSARYRFISPSVRGILGYSPEELLGSSPYALIHPEDTERIRETLHRRLLSGQTGPGIEFRFRHRDGHYVWLHTKAVPIPGQDGVIALQTLSRDVTQRREAQQELERLSTTDALTGAPNRRYFLQRFQEELQRQRRSGRTGSLIMFDIDHFKRVNDRWGHAMGDEVLKQLVSACQAKLRAHDLLGRLGGEEFAVLLPETARHGATAFAERLRQACEALVVTLGERSLRVTISLGVTVLTLEDTPERALERADRAMYAAKGAGRNRWSVAAPAEAARPPGPPHRQPRL